MGNASSSHYVPLIPRQLGAVPCVAFTAIHIAYAPLQSKHRQWDGPLIPPKGKALQRLWKRRERSVILPPELISNILYYVGEPTPSSLEEAFLRLRKKSLVACALTCSYWAKILRPFIFERITLRGPEDLTFLQELISLRGDAIAHAIHDLHIQEIDSPWIHRALSTLPRKLLEVVFLRLSTAISEKHANYNARPPAFFNLLPALCSQFKKVEHLKLEGFRFNTFAAFATCVSSFEAITCLECSRITWAQPPRDGTLTTRAGWLLVRANAISVSEPWPLAWLFTANPRHKPTALSTGHPIIAPQDLQILTLLVKAVVHTSQDVKFSLNRLQDHDRNRCEWGIDIRNCVSLTVEAGALYISSESTGSVGKIILSEQLVTPVYHTIVEAELSFPIHFPALDSSHVTQLQAVDAVASSSSSFQRLTIECKTTAWIYWTEELFKKKIFSQLSRSNRFSANIQKVQGPTLRDPAISPDAFIVARFVDTPEHEVYRAGLSHLQFGDALWVPEPHSTGEVQIGDVGYISEGQFIRVFHAVSPERHPVPGRAVPPRLHTCRMPRLPNYDHVSEYMQPGVYSSQNMTHVLKL